MVTNTRNPGTGKQWYDKEKIKWKKYSSRFKQCFNQLDNTEY